jgi:hypothetical protein
MAKQIQDLRKQRDGMSYIFTQKNKDLKAQIDTLSEQNIYL